MLRLSVTCLEPIIVLSLVAIAGCSSPTPPVDSGVGVDALDDRRTEDAVDDVSSDSGVDTGVGSGVDVPLALDAADSARDGARDGAEDAGDSALDAPRDALQDAAPDRADASLAPDAGLLGWALETVETITGTAVSIAVDSLDRPHVSYDDISSRRIKYATRDAAGVWRAEFVTPPTMPTGLLSAIAVDSSNRPCVLYTTMTNNAHLACRTAPDTWTSEFIIGSSSPPFALQVDRSGTVHALLQNAGLRYANRTGGTWRFESVSATFGRFAVMALGSGDVPNALYGESVGRQIFHGTRGTPWTTRTLVMGGGVDTLESADLDFDAMGRMHVAYANPSSATRQVFYLAPGSSTPTVIENMAAGQLSAGLSPRGAMHVVFRVASAGLTAVRHASNESGAWTVESVVERNGLPTLAVGPTGTLHIGYFDADASPRQLRYARRAAR